MEQERAPRNAREDSERDLQAVFSDENYRELEAIEQAVEERVDETLHNPYLDAFEAVYDSRKGFAPLMGIGDEDAGYVSRFGNNRELVPPGQEGQSLKQQAIQYWMFLRHRWMDRYSYAIPNEAAIHLVAQQGPIVEIGAGKGYWAYLIEQAGADVDAYDKEQKDALWFDVQEGTEAVLEDGAYDDHALFLCWPDFRTEMAADCVANYGGDTVVYVGEGEGGCTATDEFFEQVWNDEWTNIVSHEIPKWEGVRDRLYVFRRR